MIDWLTVSVALIIIATLVGIFGFVAWKINMSDPLVSANLTGKKDETNQVFDSDKKRKDKYGNEQTKKKRKDQKKPKRENKDEQDQEQHVKFKEPSTQTSEETDNEREESEHESSTPQIVETSKVRKRKNRKAHQAATGSSDRIEGILINKNEKSPIIARPQPMPHPKLAVITPKDEVELAKQHQQQGKTQGKSTQPLNKQTNAVVAATAPVPVRKPPSTNVDQGNQKQQQQQQKKVQEQQEQPFTTVGGNRHKAPTPPSQQPQQQQQQQQNKAGNITPSATNTVPAPLVQQQVQVPAQHEQLPPRQVSRQQKEPPIQHNGFNTSSAPVKQSSGAATPEATVIAQPKKVADLIKALPTSQAVVTELMSALDAFPLSTNELDIIMHKIANKQSVLNQDWTKLQHGQKVDPQAHIGQVLNESARAYEADMKTNAMKHIKDLSDELNNDKRRINDLIKEINEKDINIQFLQAQLNASQHPQQQLQNYQLELKRLQEENIQLQQRLAQQQQFQQLTSMNLVNNNSNNNNNNDSGNVQVRVLSDQIKKLSVDNGNLEKQLKAKELLVKEIQKEKDDSIRGNQQLLQKSQDNQKQYQHNEEKLLKELNEMRTLHTNQLNDYKRLIEQLELEKEQFRRSELIQIEQAKNAAVATFNNEEREKIEQLNQENQQYKNKLDELQTQYQSRENELRKEIEQLKQITEQHQQDENLKNELAAKNAQIESLQTELAETKATNDKVRIRNWKVMNELISAEEKLAAINRTDTKTQ